MVFYDKIESENYTIYDSTLFIVGSPFQCVCMLEAINHFKIVNFKVIVTYSDNYSLQKINLFLSRNGIHYTIKKNANIILNTFPFLFYNQSNFKNVFIGDFTSKNDLAIAIILSKIGGSLFYLDDGNQILTYTKQKGEIPKNSKLIYKAAINFFNLIRYLKRLKKPIFFSIYDVNIPDAIHIKNKFNLLKKQINASMSGVYIIGTNSSVLEFQKNNYDVHISNLFKIIQKRFPGSIVHYCPHRRDTNNNQIKHLCETLGIEIFKTRISVEVDFIENGINPLYVVGFASNALFTLHKIFPESIIETVKFDLTSVQSDYENKLIIEHLRENGIGAIELFERLE